MAMTEPDLAHIRDEVGDEPTDAVIDDWFDELGHWIPVAIRVLKRRRANASAGGQEVSTFALDGVLSVGMSKANLAGLDRQIAILEGMWAAMNAEPDPTGATMGRVSRPDRYR